VGNIEPSRYDAGTAYLTVDFHQVNNRDPWVYKTADYGQTWKAITNGIPRSMLSYAHCIREDPKRRGLLYLGTEYGVHVSFDDGENWQSLQLNLPSAPVYWLTFAEHFNDLVIATYGRGFWILDDLTPLQELTPQVTAADAHVFSPRVTYRLRDITTPYTQPTDATVGQDPPYGAPINYFVKTAGNVTLSVLDAKGQIVRTIAAPSRAGLNRITWDLRYGPTREVRLRTSPLYAPYVETPPEGRPGGQRFSLLAPPGTYTVKLTAGGREVTQSITVRKDPNSGGSDAEIAEQMKMLFDVRADIDAAAETINTLESIRAQLQALRRLKADPGLAGPSTAIEQKFTDIEMKLQELRTTGRGQDGVRFGARLYSKLNYLASGLMSNDYRPTAQQLEVHTVLQQQLRAVQGEMNSLISSDLASFNEKLRKLNLSTITARTGTTGASR
jgi:hypothetical protein